MTAISSHGGKKNVRIHLGSLPCSFTGQTVHRQCEPNRIGYGARALKATSDAANPP
ncbi:MAG: hypothetical protein QGI78_05955 [Phycisphaerales bacterium]|nr:hypothetical protein [Phycisphaerales bacterium]